MTVTTAGMVVLGRVAEAETGPSQCLLVGQCELMFIRLWISLGV